MASYKSYKPARINEAKCNDDDGNRKCPEKVIPNTEPNIENTQKFLYASIIKNSKKRKKTTYISQNLNEFNSISGSQGGFGSPPRNKF
ncbi:MAG: hypothetical protein CMD14_03360 [Flavobacteriales bacterium]|nr:hypothetical protein [Flavobacteriales bacterium]|tara:strand:- start:4253 stop:4516 length:264 start_codon:yes stop_codon:yes gene_type:complete